MYSLDKIRITAGAMAGGEAERNVSKGHLDHESVQQSVVHQSIRASENQCISLEHCIITLSCGSNQPGLMIVLPAYKVQVGCPLLCQIVSLHNAHYIDGPAQVLPFPSHICRYDMICAPRRATHC
jgi:hypothetical protein